jgi:hypothetical protein
MPGNKKRKKERNKKTDLQLTELELDHGSKAKAEQDKVLKEQAEQEENIYEVMETVYDYPLLTTLPTDSLESSVFSLVIGAVMKQRQYSESDIEWGNTLYKRSKIERRGQLNVPVLEDDGTLSFLPSLGEFTLLDTCVKHLGKDDTESRVVVGSLAG